MALIVAALAGACIGFMPYNLNPARIFMGDTGSLLLGYVLATVSVLGLFKFYAIVTFVVPVSRWPCRYRTRSSRSAAASCTDRARFTPTAVTSTTSSWISV